ncbi:MAG: ATP-grasp domain-containing protein [Legionella sp.]|nr:ATP-grasp domain-containing protein [Legionella sp.]
MKGKKIFVSGGAGTIGCELVQKLWQEGADVFVGDLKSKPNCFTQDVIYRQGDLNNITPQELQDFSPEIFIHLAATFERSEETKSFWEQNFQHNIKLSHHLIDIIKDLPSLKKVIFASSYLIYDPNLYQFSSPPCLPRTLSETDPVYPRNLTGMAKLAHELELRFLEKYYATQFSTVIVRIYRGYGKNSGDVISRWIRALLQQEAINVYNPAGIFDYIYAKDTAEGLIRLAKAKEAHGIVNLGTGHSKSVQDVLDILKHYFPQMIVHSTQNTSPYEASQADIYLLKRLTGWQPSYDIAEAIPEIIEFERAKLNQPHVNKQPAKILITSASRKIPLIYAVQKAAKKYMSKSWVMAGDSDPSAFAAYVADKFWLMPSLEAIVIDRMIEECIAKEINLILPTRDGELLFWAKHKTRFAESGIAVMVSDEGPLDVCLDKYAFAEFGIDRNLPFIPTFKTMNNALDKINAGRWVVKERFGAGSRLIGLNLDSKAAQDHARTLSNPIFQPYIKGVEISIDAWLDKTNLVKGLVLRYRNTVTNGESQVTTTFRDPTIEKIATRCLEQLKLSGPVVMQGIIDTNNLFHVIECNPRFGGASTVSIAVGLDSFYWSICEAMKSTVDDLPFHRKSPDLKQIRIPSDIYVNCDYL